MKKDLFTIGEVGKVCDISSSTIRRLEERGLLTPAYIDEETNYRYYDNHNINKILQIQAFQEMGLEYDDILEYYTSGGSSHSFLRKLEHKLTLIKRTVDELSLWYDNKKHLSFEFIDLPDYVCYARSFTGNGFQDQYKDMYDHCH
ncbi:MAG: MerR family transcriptional regulator, partial [Oscillospiraceae bacterium]|nr:MerR family transcriptional regulator [Oscillospiraceae bacterium]